MKQFLFLIFILLICVTAYGQDTVQGQYLKGQRQGRWVFGIDDFKKLHSELTYKDDKIVSPVLFYTTNNQLWLKAESINGRWSYFLWDKNKKQFVNSHQKYTFDFLFGSWGYDISKIK